MKRVLTILSLVAMVLTGTVRPQYVQAAGETGHSNLIRNMFLAFGFDATTAQRLSDINQAADNVPGSAATKSGIASEIIHFSRVITKTDIMHLLNTMKDIENDHHDISFASKLMMAIKRIAMNKAIGDNTGAISNAASVELLNQGVLEGDLVKVGLGTHIALDADGFHNGFKGALHVPLFGLEKIPGVGALLSLLSTLPFGHMVEGTSVDRLTVAKMALAFYTMGDFIVTVRKSLKGVGVNTAYLGYLQSQGVDVDSPESIANWFFSRPEILKVLQTQFPANKTAQHFDIVLNEVAQNLVKLGFFKNEKDVAELLREIASSRATYEAAVTKNTTYEQLAMRDLIRKAKERNLLNEQVVIRETVTDYFAVPDSKNSKAIKDFRKYVEQNKAELLERTQTIDALIQTPWASLPDYVQAELRSLHGELSTEMPFSENWILDQIAEKLTRNMVHYRSSRFNTAYMNEEVEKSQIEVERKAMLEIESVLLRISQSEALPSQYFYKPGSEHRAKVKDELFNFENYRGLNILDASIKFMDIIVTTKLVEGKNVSSIPASVKFKIFLKVMTHLAIKKASPITTKGGYFLRLKEMQEIAVQYLAEKNPDGILSVAEYNKIKEFNEQLNRRYNSDEAVGLVQNVAAGVKKGLELVQRVTTKKSASTVRCEALFD